jgi:PPE-repeat protein
MSFGQMPPEINSGRLFCGCGSASMTQAATSWYELAATLRQAAADNCAVAACLVEGWHGAVAIATARALAPYIAWLNAAATQAEHTATQAATVASAHELAMAAMVRPDVVVANRVRLLSLCTANCLAQVSPMIAQTEAEYEQMWSDDAEAMYAYARASAKASMLTPFGSPSITIDPSGSTHPDVNVRRSSRALASAADAIAAGQQVMAAIPEALQALSSSPQTTLDVHLLPVTAALSKLGSLSPAAEVAIKNLNAMNRGMMLLKAAALSAPSQCQITAGLGRAAAIGALSVPQRWLDDTDGDSVADDRYDWFRLPLHLVDATEPRGGRRVQHKRVSDPRGGD